MYVMLFIGISEVVMGGENVLQTISTSKYDTYPGIEDNEEEEEMAESLDIHTGKNHIFCYLLIVNNFECILYFYIKNLEFAVNVLIHLFS